MFSAVGFRDAASGFDVLEAKARRETIDVFLRLLAAVARHLPGVGIVIAALNRL